MKSLRFMLPVVLLSLSALIFAQSDTQKSDAQKSFEQLKTLAGSWEGQLTTTPHQADMEGKAPRITMRVTSRGNALVHEMHEIGKPDDPALYDHPLTMLYTDGNRLLLTHYCDAGNRRTERPWNSIFSTSQAAPSTATCTMWYSR